MRPNFRQELLTGLEYKDRILDPDLEAKLRIVWTLPRPHEDFVVAIMKNQKFQAWIKATDSTALLIVVGYLGPETQHLTSFICAKLVNSIMPSPSVPQTSLQLVVFCGEHRHNDDPESTPVGMMRSLLAQLLLAYRSFDLRAIQQIQNLDLVSYLRPIIY